MESERESGIKSGIKVEMSQNAMTAGTAKSQFGISLVERDLRTGKVKVVQEPLHVYPSDLEGNMKYYAAYLYEKDDKGRYIIEVEEHEANIAQTLDGELFALQVPITMINWGNIDVEYRDIYIDL